MRRSVTISGRSPPPHLQVLNITLDAFGRLKRQLFPGYGAVGLIMVGCSDLC